MTNTNKNKQILYWCNSNSHAIKSTTIHPSLRVVSFLQCSDLICAVFLSPPGLLIDGIQFYEQIYYSTQSVADEMYNSSSSHVKITFHAFQR